MNNCSVLIVDMCGGNILGVFKIYLTSNCYYFKRTKMERETSGVDNTSHAEPYCKISPCVVHASGMRVHYCSIVKNFMSSVSESFIRVMELCCPILYKHYGLLPTS